MRLTFPFLHFLVPADFKCRVTTVQRGVLECNIIKPSNNGPVPSILNWKLGGSDILGHGQDYSVTIDKSHSTLIIRNLTMDSRGNYKCVIGNADHKTYCDFELGKSATILPYELKVVQTPSVLALGFFSDFCFVLDSCRTMSYDEVVLVWEKYL